MSNKPEKQMTWVRAILLSTLFTALLIIFLGYLPSEIRYAWDANGESIAALIANTTGIEFKDPYTLVRLHDAISMGLQTFIFVIPVVAVYVIGEKRRRRLGLRGAEGVKGYLPGK